MGEGFQSGTEFGYETIILTENNLRMLFDDSDDSNDTFPSNDWQIEINESSNDGENHFAINDITAVSLELEYNIGGAEPLLLPAGSNITLATYASASLIFDGTSWLVISLNN